MDYEDLDLHPLDEEQIVQMGLSEADLWMMRFSDGNVHGPFDTKSLIQSSKVYQDEFEDIEIFNLIIEKWAPFFKTTQFQRRMPKLVPAQNLLKSQSFHVLIMGQSFGPYNLDELKTMTDEKKLRLNSEISIDAGKTWIKMYEHHEFDRRLMKNQDDLPFTPAPSIIDETEERLSLVVEEISSHKDNSPELIAGLAFVGRGNDAGHRIKYHKKAKVSEEETPSFNDEKSPKFFQTKRFVQACASFIVVAFLSVAYFNNTPQIDTEYAQDTKIKPARINNNNRGSQKRLPASTSKVDKPASKPLQKKAHKSSFAAKSSRPKIRTNSPKRVVYSHERPEELNLDDPQVREDIAREIANDEYADEEYNEEDVVEHYEEEPAQMPALEEDMMDIQEKQQIPADDFNDELAPEEDY